MLAFLEQVSPQILLLESTVYFGTSEYFSGQKPKRISKSRSSAKLEANFSRINPLIFVYLIMHTQSTQKQIIEYDIKSKYPKEYSTVDKLKCEKLLVRKSCFV